MIPDHRFLIVVVFIFVAAVNCVYASRNPQPMIKNIRESSLIVIADTQIGKQGALSYTIRVSEVIKGDKSYAGKDIELGRSGLLSTADVWLPPDKNGIAVMFSAVEPDENWEWRHLLEVYDEAAQVEALKSLIDVAAITDERKRILSLQNLFSTGSIELQISAFAEFEAIQDPQNFALLTEWCSKLDNKYKPKLITLMSSRILDRRCVPVLIEALSSTELKVRSAAARGLYFNFPGAPGIAEAFDTHLQTEGVSRLAAEYMAMRFENAKYAELAKPKTSRWLRADRLEEQNEIEKARDLYFELIADETEEDSTRRSAAQKLIPNSKPSDLERMRNILLPLLEQNVSIDNHIFVLDTVQILRGLRHPDCLPALIEVFQRQGFGYDSSMREATLAIYELGEDARAEATQKILAIIGDRSQRYSYRERIWHLLALVWLASKSEINQAQKLMDSNYRHQWADVEFMTGLNSARDETGFLIDCLGQTLKDDRLNNPEVRDWIIFRIGELKDPRGIPLLIEHLKKGIWAESLVDALVSIGGAKTEQAVVKILKHPNKQVRATATNILCKLKGADAMPLCRRILTEENFGSKGDVLFPMAHHGTVEDLALLEKVCNYWAGDRSLTTNGGSAMAEIRRRYHHDLNGPIKKEGLFKKP